MDSKSRHGTVSRGAGGNCWTIVPILAILDSISIIARMLDRTIPRLLTSRLNERLRQFPAVALLGPRQVGKTTLARTFAETGAGSAPDSTETGLYLDLESPVDQEKLTDACGYLGAKRGRLVIIAIRRETASRRSG